MAEFLLSKGAMVDVTDKDSGSPRISDSKFNDSKNCVYQGSLENNVNLFIANCFLIFRVICPKQNVLCSGWVDG